MQSVSATTTTSIHKKDKEIVTLKINQKKYKKGIYEEELDSEPEKEGNDYVTEETEEEPEKTKSKKVQQK